MPSITLVLYSQHMASASQSYDVGIIVPGLQMGWSSEKWRYLPGVTQPVPQELALERRAAWHCSDQGTFISWPSHTGPWLRKLNSEPKQERCLPGYRSLSGPPLQGCFRDSSDCWFYLWGWWNALSNTQAYFCHFKKSRQFLHLTKVKSFKALEDWERE